MFRRISTAALSACLVALAGCATYTPLPFDPLAELEQWKKVDVPTRVDESSGSGLRLNATEAEALALALNPSLQSMRAEVDVARVSAEYAGAWEDPEFEFDLLHALQSVDEPWVYGASLSFTLPISGRLSVERDIADAELRVALLEIVAEEWKVLQELRRHLTQWSSLQESLRISEKHLRLAGELREAVAVLTDQGLLQKSDLQALDLEQLTLRGDVARTQAALRIARLAVIEVIGLHPSTPLQLAEAESSADKKTEFTGPDEAELLRTNPALRLGLANYQVAEDQLRLEIRKQYPDLQLGPLLESEEGNERLGFSIALPIPLLNGNKGAIAEADARRLAAHTKLRQTMKEEVQALAREKLQLEASISERRLLEDEAGPLVEVYVESIRSFAREGRANVLQVLDALSRSYEHHLALTGLRLQESVARIDLENRIGPTLSLNSITPAIGEGSE